MTRDLRIGPKLRLPAFEAQTQTLVVYGGKGMGKTNFAAVLAEELAATRLRFSWIDPVGVAWGLRHSSDGRGDGVEVLILGGVHGDLPIEPTAGAIVADLVVDEDVSVIVDISRHASGRMWSKGEKIRFVRDYCVRLFERQGENRRPLMQIIDEAGRFVPQTLPKGSSALDLAECMGSIEELVELGRNVGVGVALITQRSARMNKSVSELAEMMVAFRTVGPRSIDAILDWFGEHVPKERQRQLVERVRELDIGTALMVSPGWLKLEGEYEIRARKTFDSSATPRAGQERHAAGRGATVDLDKYREKMVETIERAKENDPAELKKQVRELQAELRKEKAKPAAESQVSVETITETVEVPVVTEQQLEFIGSYLEHGQATIDRIQEERDRLEVIANTLEGGMAAVSEGMKKARNGAAAAAETVARRPLTPRPKPVATPRMQERAPRIVEESSDVRLGKGERTALGVLAEYPEGRTYNELAFLAGYSAKASTLGVILSNLRKAGLVEQGNQPVRLTADGLEAAGGARERPTGPALLEQWLSHPRMGEGERRVLLALIDVYPDAPSHEELCEVTGYSPVASTMGVILSKLRKLGLVEKGARRIAAEFMDAVAV